MSLVQRDRTRAGGAAEPPLTLASDVPRTLSGWDQFALWGNLGVTLTLPIAAAFVLAPFGTAPLSRSAALLAIAVGSVLGSLVLGLAAVPGTVTGAPAMVLLRGLVGRRASVVPAVLNLAQCVGWATVEVVVIAEAAARLTHESLRPLYVVLAGALVTFMALRPLRTVRLLRRFALWLVLATSVYLVVAMLRHGVTPQPRGTSWRGFWLGVDVAVALPLSWAPLVADYSRHARSTRGAFFGTFAGYAVSCAAYLALGILALSTVASDDVFGSIVAVPAGAVALVILASDELDEAFANIYSGAMSVHNLVGRADRRVVAVAIGVVATLLSLVLDFTQYESFLFLIGSVFVPLYAAVVVDFFLVRRGHWDVSSTAPTRWVPIVAWAAGFVTYQLVNPGTVGGWSTGWAWVARQAGFTPQPWMSASLLSFAVTGLLTLVLATAGRALGARRPADREPAR